MADVIIIPETPWEKWPIHEKIFGGGARGDITSKKTFYRAVFEGYVRGKCRHEFEWVFFAENDDSAAKKIKEIIDNGIVWHDSPNWVPFTEYVRPEKLRLQDISCLELYRIVASLAVRPMQRHLEKNGEYCRTLNVYNY